MEQASPERAALLERAAWFGLCALEEGGASMKIKRMTATFGCLDHQTLELEGMGSVYSSPLPMRGANPPNCAFLRVDALRPLNTREQDLEGGLSVGQTHYQPWNGGAMERRCYLHLAGQDILIPPLYQGSAPHGGFEVTFADSGWPCAQPGGLDNLRDVLIGVSRSVLSRSAFLGQSAPCRSQTRAGEGLPAWYSSGEEDVSASQVGTPFRVAAQAPVPVKGGHSHP